jgi:integrase
MALQEKMKKITISTVDSKGLYFKDIGNIFSKSELNKKDLKKLDYENIDIVIKFYFKNHQIKKTIKYTNITGLQAVKKASAIRSKLKEELELTGVIKKEHFKSLNDFFENYLELKSQSLSKNNIYSTKLSYKKWIEPEIGQYEVKKITTVDIQNIINKILKQGLKPRTALTIKQILRPIFNHAIDIGLVEINPTLKINIPSFDNTINFTLTDEKRIKLYDEIKKYEPYKYRGIMLFLYFGRRLNEVLTLQWSSVDFEQNLYTIEDRYSKIRRRQEYPLLEPLKEFLNNFQCLKRGYIFKGAKTPNITANTFRKHWKQVIKNAGIEKMRIHDTRHLLGNTLVNRGESLENIGKLLGHSSVAVTKRYAKTNLNTVDRLLNNYIGK